MLGQRGGAHEGRDDGRSFWPSSRWEKKTPRDPRPVFDSEERARLGSDPALRPFLEITQDQVAALLWACSEYFGRAGTGDLPPAFAGGAAGAEVVEAHRALRRAYAACYARVDDAPLPSAADTVFDTDERHELSYFKHVGGAEGITKDQLARLLAALDRYATWATLVQVAPLVSRRLHGHNTLVCFRDRPVSFEEFGRQIRGVIALGGGWTRPLRSLEAAVAQGVGRSVGPNGTNRPSSTSPPRTV